MKQQVKDRSTLKTQRFLPSATLFFSFLPQRRFIRHHFLLFSKFYIRFGWVFICLSAILIVYAVYIHRPLVAITAGCLLIVLVFIWEYARVLTRLQRELAVSVENLSFLAEASRVLASSLDYKTTLQNVVDLAVTHIADWCIVDVLGTQGTIEQSAIAHRDLKKSKYVRMLRKARPPNLNATYGVGHVITMGKSEIYPHITTKMINQWAANEKQRIVMQQLEFRSLIIVPILIRKKTVGIIELVLTNKKQRSFSTLDLTIAEELASRVSLAIQNALIYKHAQTAIKTRDDFISVASHELKTPITILELYVQILKRRLTQEDNPQNVFYVEKMQGQVQKLMKLIYDLLDISKIGVKKIRLEKIVFDINILVKETIDDLQTITKSHQILLKGTIAAPVYADKDRIYQVIVNLLTNAIKYSPHGDKILVTVEKDKKNISVSVHDFGIGIEKKDLKKIFERFYQVDKTQQTFPGLGMGLYISYNIIKRHGGELTVKSEKGKGSVFRFTLPLHIHKNQET